MAGIQFVKFFQNFVEMRICKLVINTLTQVYKLRRQIRTSSSITLNIINGRKEIRYVANMINIIFVRRISSRRSFWWRAFRWRGSTTTRSDPVGRILYKKFWKQISKISKIYKFLLLHTETISGSVCYSGLWRRCRCSRKLLRCRGEECQKWRETFSARCHPFWELCRKSWPDPGRGIPTVWGQVGLTGRRRRSRWTRPSKPRCTGSRSGRTNCCGRWGRIWNMISKIWVRGQRRWGYAATLESVRRHVAGRQ